MIGQLTPETPWELARHGKFTASASAPLFTIASRKMTDEELAAREKGNKRTTIEDYACFADGANTYIEEKISEIITGTYRSIETYSMEWGKNYEPEAALLLKNDYPDMIYYGKECPVFIEYSEWSGGSPDAEMPKEKLIGEIKCPENPAVHVKYCKIKDSASLLKIFKDCWFQMQFNMAAVAKKLGYDPMEMRGVFVSYSPIINPGFKNFHKALILPDQEFMTNLPAVIDAAEKELKKRVFEMKTI